MRRLMRTIAVILCLIMAAGNFAFAEEAQLISAKTKDYEGHWAQATIQKWIDEGRASGYPDGSYKPDNNVTRAEFVKMVNGLIDFEGKGKASYTDVPATEWYYDYIGIAQEIGYISGYPGGQFGPNDYITREQAASILTRIQYLDSNASGVDKFSDKSSISSWAAEAVGAASEAGFISGYNDGSFRPSKNLTRAEAVTMLENVMNNAKNHVIYNAGAKIENFVFDGGLVIAETVGEGDVTLNNVTVNGVLKVLGGGENSLYFNNVKVTKIVVEKDKVRLVIGEGTNVEEIEVVSEAVLENSDGTVAKITLTGDNAVTLSGEFKEVKVTGNSNIVLKDAKIETLAVEKPIIIQGTGTVAILQANADDIKFESKVDIKKTVVGEGVKTPPAKQEETPSGGGGGGSTDPTPDPGLTKNFKLKIEATVSKTINLGEESEKTVTKNIDFDSFNEYIGSTKISEAIGEEIKYIIDKKDDPVVIKKINEIIKPRLDELNSKLSEDIQLIEITTDEGKEAVYTNNGKAASIKWDVIESYLAGSSIVLPADLKAKDGNFSIDDIINVLDLYDSSKIESDLVKIKNNLSDAKYLTIIPMTWPDEGEPISLFAEGYVDILNEVIEHIFSNDQVYTLKDQHSFSVSQDDDNTEYEVKIIFKAIQLD